MSRLDDILLEPEQVELLVALVEASRNVPKAARQKFIFSESFDSAEVTHPGLPGQRLEVYRGDVDTLGREELISVSEHIVTGTVSFDVTPLGVSYYQHEKEHLGQPIERVEAHMRQHLASADFQRKYGEVYKKWVHAETMLWSSDSERQLTTIGHLCREVIQDFASVLVDLYQPPDVDQNKEHTVARMKAVLNHRASQVGSTLTPFLDAILSYWGTLSDLIQRQEHGGKKEGEPLIWDDAQRIVFQTLVVMFEIDRSLTRTRASI